MRVGLAFASYTPKSGGGWTRTTNSGLDPGAFPIDNRRSLRPISDHVARGVRVSVRVCTLMHRLCSTN